MSGIVNPTITSLGLPCISSGSSLYTLAISTRCRIVVRLCFEANSINLYCRQRCREARTKGITLYHTVSQRGGYVAIHLSEAAAAIEVAIHRTTRQIRSDIVGCRQRELDIVNQDTRHIRGIIRLWNELIGELCGYTTIGGIIVSFIILANPSIPFNIRHTSLIFGCIATV